MILLFDETAKLGNQAGMHALLAGVSLYPHLPDGGGRPARQNFGMEQLKSPALTAYRLYEWLVARKDHLPVPLATCRLLLSPSPEEKAAFPALASLGEPCTWENFAKATTAWREAAATNSKNQTFFYFGGHGVKRYKDDPVMLMEDFGDDIGGILDKGVSFKNIVNAMAPSPKNRPKIARTQFYFVDACRAQPDAFMQQLVGAHDIMDVDIGGEDDRRAPVFYSSVPGGVAYARHLETTLFGLALIDALNGDAADARDDGDGVRWVVTSYKLAEAITTRFNDDFHCDQVPTIDSLGVCADLHQLDAPPDVKVTIDIDPSTAAGCTKLIVENLANGSFCNVPESANSHCELSLRAGCYRLGAAINPPTPPFIEPKARVVSITPLQHKWKVKVHNESSPL